MGARLDTGASQVVQPLRSFDRAPAPLTLVRIRLGPADADPVDADA